MRISVQIYINRIEARMSAHGQMCKQININAFVHKHTYTYVCMYIYTDKCICMYAELVLRTYLCEFILIFKWIADCLPLNRLGYICIVHIDVHMYECVKHLFVCAGVVGVRFDI